ncbi:unnamed protein product [Clonostachys solani]|uniref:Uncharacterized protein n=1 Tax=Clonostachys solani TaxID=160281 RepID=A0A9N9YZ52_9HYPO|nr:unnamed protein product [Clonostachys solani]
MLLAALLFVGTASVASGEPLGDGGPPPGSEPLEWGFYATHEHKDPAKLEIRGTIPSWVTGQLYRTGPGTWDVGNFTGDHWLDGFSRNHQFHIENGTVTYRNRNSTDDLLDFVREHGVFPNGAFATDPSKLVFGQFENTFRDASHSLGDASSANVGVAYVGNWPGLDKNATENGSYYDTLVVTTDRVVMQQINPVTLEPIELFTYEAGDPLLLNSGRSATHPALTTDGNVYNYHLDLDADPPVYRVFGIEQPEGKTRILATIDDAPAAYIHALWNTDNHVILIVVQADIVKPSKGTIRSTLGDWKEDRPVLFYVVDRHNGGIVSKYSIDETFFAFHQINSFEDDNGDILIDLPRMDDYFFLDTSMLSTLRSKTNTTEKFKEMEGEFTRYRLPFVGNGSHSSNGSLITHKASVDFFLPFDEANLEMPRINEALNGRPYRYAYGLHTEHKGNMMDSIIKIDTHEKTWKVWEPAVPILPSEPIFIPNPESKIEDDGVLAFIVLDSEKKTSAVVFLDAKTMEEIARAYAPIPMGYGYHGMWAGPQAKL